MKNKNFSVRRLTVIAIILFAVCIAVGLYFAVPDNVYADEQSDTLTETDENEWISNFVTVNGWSYGNYIPEIHIFEAEAKYGSDEIKFTVTDANDEVVTNLAAADAGRYTVTAELEDSDTCSGIYETDESGERVTKKLYGQLIIRKAENEWVQYPKVIAWEYGKYNKETNLILATATYGTPKFEISDENGNVKVASFSAPYGIVGNLTETVLGNLDAGKYTLSATITGDSNHDGLIDQKVEFEVRQSENNWLMFPNVVQWQFGTYNENTNLFLASVNYGTVSFVVYDSEGGEALTPVFTATDGVIDGDENGLEAIEVLSSLKKGTYYLTATVDVDNPNYKSVAAGGRTFEVYEAANGWRVLPNVINWQYGDYEAQTNLVMGVPYYGTVTFGIYDEDGEALTDPFTTTDGVIDDADGTIAAVLKGISAGTYRLTAVVETDDNNNYSALSSVTSFLVTQAVNSWIETPSIESWVKGKYSPDLNFISAQAAFGEVEYIIYDTTDETNIIYHLKGSQELVNKLSKASSGYYTLKATVTETGDYSDLEKTFTFRIFPRAGLQWWAILLIVVGALGIVALVMFILHQKGVFQWLSGKFLVSMRARMTVDATIAAVRANKVAEEAKKTVAEAEAREKAEEEAKKAEAKTVEAAKKPETEEKAEKPEQKPDGEQKPDNKSEKPDNKSDKNN